MINLLPTEIFDGPHTKTRSPRFTSCRIISTHVCVLPVPHINPRNVDYTRWTYL